jgi:hypothetical protein
MSASCIVNLALIAHKRQLVAAHIGVIIDGQIVLYPLLAV